MNNSKKAGALKSWSCVAMLTFFVPAAGFELSTVFFSASAVVGERISSYLVTPEESSGSVVITCRKTNAEEII